MKQRTREREIVVTIPRAIWEELQNDVRADGLEGEHGANQRVLMRWLADYLRSKGRLGGHSPGDALVPGFDD